MINIHVFITLFRTVFYKRTNYFHHIRTLKNQIKNGPKFRTKSQNARSRKALRPGVCKVYTKWDPCTGLTGPLQRSVHLWSGTQTRGDSRTGTGLTEGQWVLTLQGGHRICGSGMSDHSSFGIRNRYNIFLSISQNKNVFHCIHATNYAAKSHIQLAGKTMFVFIYNTSIVSW